MAVSGTCRWLAVPNDLLRRMEADGLNSGTMILNLAAWVFAADYMTDGLLLGKEASRLQGFADSRRGALVAAGYWLVVPGGFQLVGYLDCNTPKDVIDARRAANRRRWHDWDHRHKRSDDPHAEPAGGESTNAFANGPLPLPLPKPRKDNVDGYTADEVPPAAADDGPGWQSVVDGPNDPGPPGPTIDEVEISGRGRDKGNPTAFVLLPRWEEPAWEPLRSAWEGRGLQDPPTGGQRRLLWHVLKEFPKLTDEWTAEAPHDGTVYEVVRYVLNAAERERARRRLPAWFADLTAEEQAHWRDAEASVPWGYQNRMRLARERGEGLPGVEPGANPLRAVLPEMLAWAASLAKPAITTNDAGSTPWVTVGEGDLDTIPF